MHASIKEQRENKWTPDLYLVLVLKSIICSMRHQVQEQASSIGNITELNHILG